MPGAASADSVLAKLVLALVTKLVLVLLPVVVASDLELVSSKVVVASDLAPVLMGALGRLLFAVQELREVLEQDPKLEC